MAGVIEGFYGPPWSHRDRLDMLAFLGRVGLTDYVYAPKNDPYHRDRWRDPYPPDARAQLGELAAAARAAGVRMHFAISPGGTMVYSDSLDYRTLRRKLADVRDLGIAHFALFFDDVPPRLSHAADRERYADLATAQAELINRLAADLRSEGAALTVTPTTYTDAWGDQLYARRLGELTDATVPFFWTGADVVSPMITAADGDRWHGLLGRRVLIWDNYPVNDFARWRPFLGPFRGRGPSLGRSIGGLVSNPMNEAHASMLPLATLAQYARAPGEYDPDAALARAADDLFGDAAGAVLTLQEVWGSPADQLNVFDPVYLPGRPIDSAAVETALATVRGAIQGLRAAGERNGLAQAVGEELTPMYRATEERWRSIRSDVRYLHERGVLRYDVSVDRLRIPFLERPRTIDGRLEGLETPWVALTHPNAAGQVRAALMRDTAWLYVVVDVDVPVRRVAEGEQVGDADHLALVLQGDGATDRYHLAADDLVLLFPAPRSEVTTVMVAQVQRYEGFMAKYMADNRGMTLGEFHLTTFGQPAAADRVAGIRYAARRSAGGYVAEIRVPLRSDHQQRLSLTVTTSEGEQRPTYGLASRNYPTNPATFVQLVW